MRQMITLVLFVFALTSAAQEHRAHDQDAGRQKKESADTTKMEDRFSVTSHEVTVGRTKVKYEAKAGTMILRKEDGTARGSVFYIAYMRNDDTSVDKRPVTFSFNGGPGSSSVWLHLGLLGPKVVEMDKEGFPLPPPYRLVENKWSMLDKTDLVFIDPVGTGYSRTAKGQDRKQFHGLEEDIESVGEFIRLWITRNQRWASPKFLIGESYGTTRAAGLSRHLQRRHGMYLNGIMLVSAIMNFQTARFNTGNDLPYITFLPTYAVTAWYHERLSAEHQDKSLEAFAQEVREFALNQYGTALLKGSKLPKAEFDEVARKLAGYTGLSEDYVRQTRLRIRIRQFAKELKRDSFRTVGRLDSRFEGIDRDAAGDSIEYDPSMEAIRGPYTATMNDYVRRELNFESDLVYEILSGRVRPWSYKRHENRYVDVSEDLREAMTANRDLKVFVANGYYDLATPFFAAEYTIDHMMLDPSLEKNITMTYYPAGHMMYIQQSSLEKMKKDMDKFMEDALK
ncbi:MAG: peptidase S10 [Acidobacteriota bacterium]|nr:peptidase S10 [Acidobacteriota bacterium]